MSDLELSADLIALLIRGKQKHLLTQTLPNPFEMR